MEYIIGTIFVIIAGLFAYVSTHVIEEERQGRFLPLLWERKKRKLFDKSDLEYKDGDNT